MYLQFKKIYKYFLVGTINFVAFKKGRLSPIMFSLDDYPTIYQQDDNEHTVLQEVN